MDADAEDVLRKGFVEGKEMLSCLSIYLFILTEENILVSSVLAVENTKKICKAVTLQYLVIGSLDAS